MARTSLCAARLILCAVCVLLLPVLLIRGGPCFPFCVSFVIWLLPVPHSVLYGAAIAVVFVRLMAARRFSYVVLRGAYGGGFLAVWFGVENARMRLGGAVLCLDSARSPLFLLFSSLFAFFYPFVLSLRPRSLLSPLRAASISHFLSSLSLSSLSFFSPYYLCALFLADGFLPLTS